MRVTGRSHITNTHDLVIDMDMCERCAHYVSDDEYGDYCDINLDEDEMEKFLTQNMKTCHYFQLDDEYGIVRKQN